MLEPQLIALLHGVVGEGSVYADVALSGAKAPWVTFQQIGGKSPIHLDQQLVNKRNGLFQISVYALDRPRATQIALQIEAALSLSEMQVAPVGAMRSSYELETKLYGAMQDFSIWADR